MAANILERLVDYAHCVSYTRIPKQIIQYFCTLHNILILEPFYSKLKLVFFYIVLGLDVVNLKGTVEDFLLLKDIFAQIQTVLYLSKDEEDIVYFFFKRDQFCQFPT